MLNGTSVSGLSILDFPWWFSSQQFNVTAAIMVQRSIGVKKRKQDVIAFVNTVTQFIYRGRYAHIVT
jgi:hypothetical protein